MLCIICEPRFEVMIMTVFLKSGLLGVLVYLYFIYSLFGKIKSEIPIVQNINLLFVGTGIFLILSSWVFMGVYNLSDNKSILIGMFICLREIYIKEKNEDFVTLMRGVLGPKRRIHIHVGDVLDKEIDVIKAEFDSSNKQVQALAQSIDDSILSNYRLWPTNYIAYDIVNQTTTHSHLYSENEKSLFERRLEMRIDHENPLALQGFLAMYANPVVNKMKYENAI